MWLRKDKGGSTVEGVTWEHDGDVREVPDVLGTALLGIRGGGYEAVAEPPRQAPPAKVPAAPAPVKPAAKP
jgi:hypothetical protein